jgi:hypothetical protein
MLMMEDVLLGSSSAEIHTRRIRALAAFKYATAAFNSCQDMAIASP